MRALVAVASAVVLVITGYAWTAFSDLQSGLSTSDVTAGAGPDGSVDILLVGMDSRTDARGNPLPDDVLRRLRAGDNEGNLTDTLILVHIPKDRSRAVAYSVPRDSYVSMPDGHGHHKINSAYARGKSEATDGLRQQGVTDPAELERRSADAGRKLTVRTVEGLTGVGIDHFAEVNLLGFDQITQAAGGVEVCLNDPVDEPRSGADFPAGRQTISGSDALAFVRQRHDLPRGDLDRVVRQQAFLAGLARSMLSTGVLANPSTLNGLFDSVQQSVVLDQGWDVLTFAQQMQGLAGGNISFDTIPVENSEYDTPDGVAVKVDPNTVHAAIEHSTDARPQQSTPPEPPPGPPAGLDAVTVDVRNTTDHSGLAGRVRDVLAQGDIPVGDTANAASRGASRVTYPPGAGDAARYVAEQLDGVPVKRDSDLPNNEMRVLLANDYQGPARHPGSSTPPGQVHANQRGGDTQSQQSEPPAQDESGHQPITAGGVPCIN